VDTRSEWRTFAGDEGGDDPSRVGDAGNPLLGSNYLETSISGQDGRTGLARDLQRAQSRMHSQANGKTSTVALSAAFGRIAEKFDAMQLPRAVLMRAQHVYKIADEKKVVRGKNDKAIIAACIIFACRDAGANRSFQEVCKVTKVSKKELGQVFVLVKAAVQEEQGKDGRGVAGQSNVQNSAEGLLGRFCNYLDLGNMVYNAAKHIVVQASSKSAIDGRSPVSIAAGVLLFACVLFEKSTTAKDIARVADVSESTIKLQVYLGIVPCLADYYPFRSICKKVAVKLDEVIRPEWVKSSQKLIIASQR